MKRKKNDDNKKPETEADGKLSKACKKAKAETDKLDKKQEAEAKWNKKIEEATQVAENEKENKVKQNAGHCEQNCGRFEKGLQESHR